MKSICKCNNSALPTVAVQSDHRTASLPGVGGMQFSRRKWVRAHEIARLHAINQKKPKYSTKSATRTFRQRRLKFKSRLRRPNASRFSSRTNSKFCRNVEEDYWSMLVQFAFLERALVARNSRKTPEFSIQNELKSQNSFSDPISDVLSRLASPRHYISDTRTNIYPQ